MKGAALSITRIVSGGQFYVEQSIIAGTGKRPDHFASAYRRVSFETLTLVRR